MSEETPSQQQEIATERLDSEALKVIYRLHHMKHQAYLVGGCVRDVMLGLRPKDFDIATSAHPGEVRAAFRNCRLIGRRFRLAQVYFRGGKVIEVATFRTNPVEAMEDIGAESDLLITRDNVFGTAEEDARRRDFTVNGLFYDVFAGKVIDYVGGREDLNAHRIATIGDPEIRMREDPVRALRAVRFAARLGFSIHPDTFAAMRNHASELARCAPARVLEETFKILRCGGASRALELLRACGALPVILPALVELIEQDDQVRRRLFAHLGAMDALVREGPLPSDAVLLGALLIHLPISAERGEDSPAEELLENLVRTSRLPRRVAERVRLAIRAQRNFDAVAATGKRRRRRGALSRQSYFQDALQLFEITVRATGEGAEQLARWKVRFQEGGRDGGGRGGESREEAQDSGDGAPEAPRGAGSQQGGPNGESGAEGGSRRRRRRRGGRRRRRRGGASSAQPGQPPQG
jgi:poly(A) polymerase